MAQREKITLLDWITRPRQIFILFVMTMAFAAMSANNKIHNCHSKHRRGLDVKYQKVAELIQPNDFDANAVLAREVRNEHNAITAKDATRINELSDHYLSNVNEDEVEEDMAEELGMQDPAGGKPAELAHKPRVGEGDNAGGAVSTPIEGAQEKRREKMVEEAQVVNNSKKNQGENEGKEDKVKAKAASSEAVGGEEGATGSPPPPHQGSSSSSKVSKHKQNSSSGTTFCPAIHERLESGLCDYESTPEALHKYFKADFPGDLILTSTSLKAKTVLAVSSPGQRRKTKLTDVTPHLLSLLPSHDAIFGKNFTSCAVIGSSGILLKYEHGKEIDTHDMVLRFNSARTKGFEKHVGGKTTHRLTNSRNFEFRESKSEHVLVHLRTPGATKALIQRLRNKNKSILYGLNPPWYAYMDKNLNFLSTSGLNGILMALHKCEHVRLYGFHVHPRHGVPYHYYNVKDKPANVGRDDSEWLVVKHLIENNFVELGEPCILECNENESECQKCIKSNQ